VAAQAEISELKETVTKLNHVTKDQRKVIEALTGNGNNTIVLRAQVSRLENTLTSDSISVEGHKFCLGLRLSSLYWHSLYLVLMQKNDRVGSVNINAEFSLVSHNSRNPTKKSIFNQLYTNATTWSISNYIETTILRNGGYAKDGEVTLMAQINITWVLRSEKDLIGP
jgi:hypothetical protein